MIPPKTYEAALKKKHWKAGDEMKGTGTVKHMILLQNGRKLNEFLL